MAKKKTTKKTSRRAARNEILVVNSKVKAACAAQGLRVGSDFTQALSNEVHGLIKKASRRAAAGKRVTLKASDL